MFSIGYKDYEALDYALKILDAIKSTSYSIMTNSDNTADDILACADICWHSSQAISDIEFICNTLKGSDWMTIPTPDIYYKLNVYERTDYKKSFICGCITNQISLHSNHDYFNLVTLPYYDNFTHIITFRTFDISDPKCPMLFSIDIPYYILASSSPEYFDYYIERLFECGLEIK